MKVETENEVMKIEENIEREGNTESRSKRKKGGKL